MEAGIKYRDLRNGAAQFFDQRNAVEFQTIVKWRKDGHFFDRGLYLRRDQRLDVVKRGRHSQCGGRRHRFRIAIRAHGFFQRPDLAADGQWRQSARLALQSCFCGCPGGCAHFERGTIVAPFHLAFPQRFGRSIRERCGQIEETGLLATRPGIEHQDFHLVRPFPVADFRQVVAVFADVLFVLDEFVAQQLFEVRIYGTQTRDAIHNIAGKMKAIEFIEHRHIERRGGGAFFAVAVDVEVRVVGAFVGEAVNERGIAVEGEDHRLVGGEDGIEFAVGESMRMFGRKFAES